MSTSLLLRDYSAQNIQITWDGIPFVAYKDTFATIQFDTASISTKKGMDGNVCFTAMQPPTATITITTEAYSPTNRLLWAVAKEQIRTSEPKVGSLKIVDEVHGDILTGLNTVLNTPSDITYGKTHDMSERKWVFTASDVNIPDTIL